MNEHKARLQKARELLRAGWCQGITYQKDPAGKQPTNYCLLGSIDAACGCHDAKEQMTFAMANALSTTVSEYVRIALQAENGYRDIVNFNDKPGRTKEEVLAVLDKAIASIPEE